MKVTLKKLSVVGDFIRKRREALGISQRALGMLFYPAVTTQFVSNVERGVTPLPPSHIPYLAIALRVEESELTTLMERDYAMRLNGRMGKPLSELEGQSSTEGVAAGGDYHFIRNLYDAYMLADLNTRQTFNTVCESILKVRKAE